MSRLITPEGGVPFNATPSAPSGGAQTPGVHAVCHTVDARSGIDLTHSPEGGVSFNATPSAPSGGPKLTTLMPLKTVAMKLTRSRLAWVLYA